MEVETAPSTDDEVARFEDLTVDDDLPILDRVVRYSSSQVALQRLVHVKMLSETAELAGAVATRQHLIPAIQPLLRDAETVIRQHVAAQLLPLSMVCMLPLQQPNLKGAPTLTVQQIVDNPSLRPASYIPEGYAVVTTTVITYLNTLVSDPELDVRRAAADSLSGLALHIRPADVPAFCLPIPLRLALQKPAQPATGKKKSEGEQHMEELRVTACNLLAEMGGAAAEHAPLRKQADWVAQIILPAVLDLSRDTSFRVRRSAVQALPRILGACSVQHAADAILPAFAALSQDELHRVRKSAGECLVDMSRAMMILASSCEDKADQERLFELRRSTLLPIADRLIQDPHKMVRQGMMQFLGPFVASFYPYQYSALHQMLPTGTESDGSHHLGIAAQFFPHATSMVARLNSSHNAVATAPTPVHGSLRSLFPPAATEWEQLHHALPTFIHASRMSQLSLAAVIAHRTYAPPNADDLQAVTDTLLDYFAALAVVATGDANTDAEMRVYCAYSFPAVVLLMGPDHWDGSIKTCFHTLLNPNYGQDDGMGTDGGSAEAAEPPLPVKRCLASSLHTVAHVLGPELASVDILPVVQEYFLRDSDESVRLNMLRNFSSLLSLLPPSERVDPFLLWSQVVTGDECLGAHRKRSATNPVVLNWRQRDYLARSLPDLIGLIDPVLVYDHIWPILKQVLSDPINVVQDDALWSVPIMLKAYCPESMQQNWPGIKDPRTFSNDCCKEIVAWIQEHILHRNPNQAGGGRLLPHVPQRSGSNISSSGSQHRPANFNERQVYCRICGATGLALRLSEEGVGVNDADDAQKKDPVAVLSEKLKKFFFADNANQDREGRIPSATEHGPYQKLTPAEKKHLRRVLVEDLIPPALEMKEDRISNVRITLMKALLLMPSDIQAMRTVRVVLKDLVEESETWESFGGNAPFEMPSVLSASTREDDLGSSSMSAVPLSHFPSSKHDLSSSAASISSASSLAGADMAASIESASSTSTTAAASESSSKSGPIDMDITPVSSFDEGDQDQARNDDGGTDSSRAHHGGENEDDVASTTSASSGSTSSSDTVNDSDDKEKITEATPAGGSEPPPTPLSPSRSKPGSSKSFSDEVPSSKRTAHSKKKSDPPSSKARTAARYKSMPATLPSLKSVAPPVEEKNEEDAAMAALQAQISAFKMEQVGTEEVAAAEDSSSHFKKTAKNTAEEVCRTVVFDDGPIGLQLEPTKNDRACRVCGFLDAGPDKPSPARKAGKIRVGDVIVMVNSVSVKSYDETITILRAGGHREIVFRPGTSDDDLSEEEQDANEGDDGEVEGSSEKETKKAPLTRKKSLKKIKKEGKKEKSPKKELSQSRPDKKEKDSSSAAEKKEKETTTVEKKEKKPKKDKEKDKEKKKKIKEKE